MYRCPNVFVMSDRGCSLPILGMFGSIQKVYHELQKQGVYLDSNFHEII